jgi:RNA-directed DNA polymerase
MSLVEYIANELLLAPQFVATLCRTASFRYKEYQIRKRTGGVRTIAHPSRALKGVQRFLLHRFVVRLPIHASSSAYGPADSVRKHAERHQNAQFLLRMDFSDFFPSLRASDVAMALQGPGAINLPIAMTGDDVRAFCELVCRNGRLAIGAPTSPQLANALMHDFDHEVAAMVLSRGVTYTRYADDLYFSAAVPDVLRQVEVLAAAIVNKCSFPRGLSLNLSKTRHVSKKRVMRVTGVTLATDGTLSVGRDRKRGIRALLHRYDSLTEVEKQQLAGMLGFAFDVEPDLANRLVRKYGAARVRGAMRPPVTK